MLGGRYSTVVYHWWISLDFEADLMTSCTGLSSPSIIFYLTWIWVCVCVYTLPMDCCPLQIWEWQAQFYIQLSHSTPLFSLNILSVVLLPWRRLLLALLVLLFWWWVGGNIETLSLSKGIGNFQMASPLSLTQLRRRWWSSQFPREFHLILSWRCPSLSTPLHSTLLYKKI